MKQTLLLLALVLAPQIAGAHATPVSYLPAAATTLTDAPKNVSITFSERAEPKASNIIVFAPDGTKISQEHAMVSPSDPYLLTVPMGQGGSGTYAVSWQVISADDGHFTKGAYVFFVGTKGEEVASHSPLHVLHQTSLKEAFSIWMEFLGQTIVFGSLLLLFVVLKRENDAQIHRRITILQILGIALILLGIAMYLIVRSLDLVSDTVSFQQAVLTFMQTVTGKFALYRAILALLYGLVLWFPRRLWRDSLLLVFVLSMMFMRARVSHAAASHLWPTFSIFMNFIHVIGKGAWIGGLVVFTTAILPIRSDALSKFSKLLAVALGVGGVSGAYVVWLHLKDFGNIQTTLWGTHFLWLSGFAGLLLALRFYNHFRATTRHLSTSLGIETMVGLIVLWFSSLLIITTPPFSYQPPYHQAVESQGVRMELRADPYDTAHMILTFDTQDIRNVVVTLQNEEKNVGPIIAHMERHLVNDFIFHTREFSLPGLWDIDVTATRKNAYDVVGSFTLTYPTDVESYKQFPATLFTTICAVAAVILAALSFYLFNREHS